MTNQPIPSQRITLRPATLAERRTVYEWIAFSDVTSALHGPPTYPDHLVATWEEFCEDHTPHFFDGSAPELGQCFIIVADGEDVGQVYYNDIDMYNGRRRTELDVWMRAEKYCGRGWGSEAILTLCNYLARQLQVEQFMMQPSARNPRAIRAYEKIGFVPLEIPLDEARAIWGPNDYFDSVYMVKTISPENTSNS